MTAAAELVVIDTTCWIEAMRQGGDEDVRRQVTELLQSNRARFVDIVRLELHNGVGAGAERSFLRDVEALVDTLPTSPEVWGKARSLASKARAQGITVPATDLLVYAATRVHRVGLLHRDGHFEMLAAMTGAGEKA